MATLKEAPLLPMLALELKQQLPTDLKTPLLNFIEMTYGDASDSWRQKAETLSQLRNDVGAAGKDNQGRDLLYKYYGQIELLELHFPLGTDECPIEFNWTESMGSKEKLSQNSGAFEKASVIFNLAATITHIASKQNRAEEQGLKTAFNYYQCAAGIFNFIKDYFLHSPATDMSKEFVTLASALMLGQAQECFVDKLILEDKKQVLIMKASAQVAQFYQTAVDAFTESQDKLKSYLPTPFKNYIQVKLRYFLALSNAYYCAINESKYGEIVARYGLSVVALKEALKLVQEASSESVLTKLVKKSASSAKLESSMFNAAQLEEGVQKLLSFLTLKNNTAIKDNDVIYHDNVPTNITLALADKLSMAEPKKLLEVFPNMAQLIGGDLFEDLLPISVHEQSSLYSEEKSKLLRNQSSIVDELNGDMEARLSSMKIKEVLDSLKTRLKQEQGIIEVELPTELAEIVSSVSREEQNGSLQSVFDKVQAESQKCYGLIKEVQVLVKGQSTYETKAGQLEQSHAVGAKGDQILQEKYQKFGKDLKLLCGRSQTSVLKEYKNFLFSQAPSNAQPQVNLLDMPVVDYSEDFAMIQQLDNLMQDLFKLKQARTAKLDELKMKLLGDDISKLLVYNKKNETGVIQQELKKFEPFLKDLDENYKAHAGKLEALINNFGKLSSSSTSGFLKKVESEKKKKTEFIQRIRDAKNVFDELKFNSKKGLEYYASLLRNVEDLKAKYLQYLSSQPQQAPAQQYQPQYSALTASSLPTQAPTQNFPKQYSAPMNVASPPPQMPQAPSLALPSHLQQPLSSLGTVAPLNTTTPSFPTPHFHQPQQQNFTAPQYGYPSGAMPQANPSYGYGPAPGNPPYQGFPPQPYGTPQAYGQAPPGPVNPQYPPQPGQSTPYYQQNPQNPPNRPGYY
ncbi:hypothetical protein MP638_003404 [Amoeboaphelidium occidentale]|nr:hypothetical protein MP638_003404 [Amoeboaphelidium occidentale]